MLVLVVGTIEKYKELNTFHLIESTKTMLKEYKKYFKNACLRIKLKFEMLLPSIRYFFTIEHYQMFDFIRPDSSVCFIVH